MDAVVYIVTQPSDLQAEATLSSMHRAALSIAARGVPVFPCRSNKRPHYQRRTLEHGHLNATTDLAQITSWWATWPEANVALPTGEASGIISLDLDT